MVPGFRGPTPPKPGQHRVRGLTPREVARIGRGRHNVGVPDLDSSFFAHPPVDVAPKLLGLTVSHAGVTLRITEVEAYHGAVDPGSHGFKRRTDRNSALFGPPGTCYVYINYGIHRALNLVCGADGESAGCLVRSGEIIDGLDLARERRMASAREGAPLPKDAHLARGPGNLAKALAIEPILGGTPVVGPDAQVVVRRPDGHVAPEYLTGPRVGVSGPGGEGESFPWRFWIPGEPSLSAYRAAVTRVRKR